MVLVKRNTKGGFCEISGAAEPVWLAVIADALM
jgi:hypothetical protein